MNFMQQKVPVQVHNSKAIEVPQWTHSRTHTQSAE